MLKRASKCDLVMLQKEMVQIKGNISSASEELCQWEAEVKTVSSQPSQAKTTRPSRVQRGSVVFQGMASLIGEEPGSASEQHQEAVKEIANLKESLKESEENLKKVTYITNVRSCMNDF